MTHRVTIFMAMICLCALAAVSWGAKICIDPGHGGTDAGAVGCGQYEKTNVLNTSIKFRDWLNTDTSDGGGGGSWSVVMTRSSDAFVSLQGRCDIANANGANSFLSIHNNACGSCGATGMETYCHTSLGSSADLRNKVQSRMLSAWGLYNRGNKSAAFYVLAYTNMEATLTELGFIDTCSPDAGYVGNSGHQDSAARAHMYAVQTHYGLAAYTPSSGAYTKIHVFHRGGSDKIYENYWTGTSWSGGVDLGGTTYSAPAACSGNGTGNIHVFHRGTNNNIYERYWTGSSWTSWAIPFAAQTLDTPAVCTGNGTNNIHVFHRGTDNQIWENYWTGSAWSSGVCHGAETESAPAACAGNGTNNIHIFHRGMNNKIYERYWTGSSWTAWGIPFDAQTPDAPAVCTGNGTNNIHVFHRGMDNQIWENYWTGIAWSTGICHGGTTYSAPTVVRAANTGNIHIFHRGTDNKIYERYWTGSSWTNWSCPFPTSTTTSAPAACTGN